MILAIQHGFEQAENGRGAFHRRARLRRDGSLGLHTRETPLEFGLALFELLLIVLPDFVRVKRQHRSPRFEVLDEYFANCVGRSANKLVG